MWLDLYSIPLLNHKIVMRKNGWPLWLAVVVLLSACRGTQPQQDPLNVDQQDTSVQDTRLKKTRSIFFNIPSPMETAALLKKAGAQYNAKILNDVKNVDRYTTASQQAVNLGVYGADLSYASVFDQTQESMFYTATTRKLADKLGITSAFDDGTVERMEQNMNDRDSLLNIISETYWNMDGYLKENGRDNISALMIAGGWLEGLYIATQIAKTNDSPELRTRIAEQKLSLGDLIALLDTYESEDDALVRMRNDLRALSNLFAAIEVGTDADPATEQDGVVVIGGPSSASLTDEQLSTLRQRTLEIRNQLIN